MIEAIINKYLTNLIP